MYVRLGVMRNMAVKCLGSHLVHVSRTSLLYNVHHAMKKFNTHTREREREGEGDTPSASICTLCSGYTLTSDITTS